MNNIERNLKYARLQQGSSTVQTDSFVLRLPNHTSTIIRSELKSVKIRFSPKNTTKNTTNTTTTFNKVNLSEFAKMKVIVSFFKYRQFNFIMDIPDADMEGAFTCEIPLQSNVANNNAIPVVHGKYDVALEYEPGCPLQKGFNKEVFFGFTGVDKKFDSNTRFNVRETTSDRYEIKESDKRQKLEFSSAFPISSMTFDIFETNKFPIQIDSIDFMINFLSFDLSQCRDHITTLYPSDFKRIESNGDYILHRAKLDFSTLKDVRNCDFSVVPKFKFLNPNEVISSNSNNNDESTTTNDATNSTNTTARNTEERDMLLVRPPRQASRPQPPQQIVPPIMQFSQTDLQRGGITIANYRQNAALQTTPYFTLRIIAESSGTMRVQDISTNPKAIAEVPTASTDFGNVNITTKDTELSNTIDVISGMDFSG